MILRRKFLFAPLYRNRAAGPEPTSPVGTARGHVAAGEPAYGGGQRGLGRDIPHESHVADWEHEQRIRGHTARVEADLGKIESYQRDVRAGRVRRFGTPALEKKALVTLATAVANHPGLSARSLEPLAGMGWRALRRLLGESGWFRRKRVPKAGGSGGTRDAWFLSQSGLMQLGRVMAERKRACG